MSESVTTIKELKYYNKVIGFVYGILFMSIDVLSITRALIESFINGA